MPLRPELLDYDSTQSLLVGSDIEKIKQRSEQGDGTNGVETPLEEMEKLEAEDEYRVEHLKGDDPVFEVLGLSSKDYSKLQTTW